MVFWEWKTGRIKSRLKAHSKVVIAHEWLPHETVSCFFAGERSLSHRIPHRQSKVITASWDGLIKLWVSVHCDRWVKTPAERYLTPFALYRIDLACVVSVQHHPRALVTLYDTVVVVVT